MFKHVFVFAIGLLAMIGFASADLYDDALGDMKRGDYAAALQKLRPLAEAGHANAQYGLGHLYDGGRGVRRDYVAAVGWFRLAAAQSFAKAQTEMGLAFYSGKGVGRDLGEAVKWYRRAADQDEDVALRNLGLMYLDGEGVRQDYDEAMRLFRRSAEQGNMDAHMKIGGAYFNGEWADQDYDEAVKWYRLAAEKGHSPAQSLLGLLYEFGEGVDRDLVEAAKWYRLAAEQGDAKAQANLGRAYLLGQGVEQDYDETVKWIRPAAEHGEAEAQFILGLLYARGGGLPQDEDEAKQWLKLAAGQGHPGAQHALETLLPTSEGNIPSLPSMQSLLELKAEDLSQEYLAIEQSPDIIRNAMRAVGRLSFQTFDGQMQEIDKSNADRFLKYWQDRLDLYRQAIEQRGYPQIAGRYKPQANSFCRGKELNLAIMFSPNPRESDAALLDEVTIRQEGFTASIVDSAGNPVGLATKGIVVNGGVAFGDPMIGFVYLGPVEDSRIDLRLNAFMLRSAIGDANVSEDGWLVADKCVISLMRQ